MYKRPFIHVFREAVRDADLPPAHKLLLHNMAVFANGEGGKLFPSQATLAKAGGCSDRTIRTHTKHLESAGWLEIVERGHSGDGKHGGQRRANVYQLNIGRDFNIVLGDAVLENAQNSAAPKEKARTSTPVVAPVESSTGKLPVSPESSFNSFGADLSADDILDS